MRKNKCSIKEKLQIMLIAMVVITITVTVFAVLYVGFYESVELDEALNVICHTICLL